jgi:hypothetical protein
MLNTEIDEIIGKLQEIKFKSPLKEISADEIDELVNQIVENMESQLGSDDLIDLSSAVFGIDHHNVIQLEEVDSCFSARLSECISEAAREFFNNKHNDEE